MRQGKGINKIVQVVNKIKIVQVASNFGTMIAQHAPGAPMLETTGTIREVMRSTI